jgi:hypothetical protein
VLREKIVVRENGMGRAVYAEAPIRSGEVVLEFAGPRLSNEQIHAKAETEHDYHLQIGENLYIGPSGQADDFVNHSCSPNCRVAFEGTRVTLRALRNIGPAEEITFDYSTTMDEDDWEMQCACGHPDCRGTIKDFRKLPVTVRNRYIELNAVPEFILRRLTQPSSAMQRAAFDESVCPVCGETARAEKCKVVCRSAKCTYRIIYNCSEF